MVEFQAVGLAMTVVTYPYVLNFLLPYNDDSGSSTVLLPLVSAGEESARSSRATLQLLR
jgi:hypothetical protein